MSDRFDHLAIAAADFDKSLAFYRDVLGWRVIDEWPDRGAGRGAGRSQAVAACSPASHDAPVEARSVAAGRAPPLPASGEVDRALMGSPVGGAAQRRNRAVRAPPGRDGTWEPPCCNPAI